MSAQSSVLKNYAPLPPVPVKDNPTSRYLRHELNKVAAAVQLSNQVTAQIDPSNNVYKVSTLPTNPVQGQRAFVTDASSPTFGSPVSGGSTTFIPVHYTGAAWHVG